MLARQAPHVQRFLLQMAVVRRMNAALCTAVTHTPDSQALLEFLERRNLFVVPLDDERQWYRMHDLFREVLLARLQAAEPALIPQLHARAARWFAAQGDVRTAMTHAFAAQEFAYAAALVERGAPDLWLHGEAHTVHAWIQALPDAVVHQHARLALDAAVRLLESFHAAVAHTYQTIQANVEHTLARVEAVLDALPDAERAVIERRIGLLRALLATRAALMRNDAEQMRLLADHSAALADGEEGSWKLLALRIAFWSTESLQRAGVVLIPHLLVAKQQVRETGNQEDLVRVMRMLAFAYVRAGRLRLMEEESLAALRFVDHTGQQSAASGYFYLYLAWAYYESNRLPTATRAVRQVLEIAQTWQHADLLIVGHIHLLSIALAQGEDAEAEQALLATEALIEQTRLETHTSTVIAMRVQYWLVTGNLAAASRWADQVVFSPETWHPNRMIEFLLLVRVYLAHRGSTNARVWHSDSSAYFWTVWVIRIPQFIFWRSKLRHSRAQGRTCPLKLRSRVCLHSPRKTTMCVSSSMRANRCARHSKNSVTSHTTRSSASPLLRVHLSHRCSLRSRKKRSKHKAQNAERRLILRPRHALRRNARTQ